MRLLRARVLCLCSVLGLAAISGTAHAQKTPAPLAGHDFTIDLVTGPVIGSGRLLGMGGAYTALAFGADGAAWTPAAYAARSLWELSWYDWDVAFDYSPALFRNTDFDNNGTSGVKYGNLLFLTLGGRFELGEFGFGGLVRVQDYDLGSRANLTLLVANYGIAYSLLQGQLMVGFGLRTASLSIDDRRSGNGLVSFTGTGPEVGAVLGLAGQPFRVGVAARLTVLAGKDDSTRVAAGLTLPTKIALPEELALGFAYQLGSRPLNRRFVNPRDFERKLRAEMIERRERREHEQALREAEAEELRLAAESGPPLHESTLPSDPSLLPPPRDRDFWIEEERTRRDEERALHDEVEGSVAARKAEVESLSRRYLLLSSDVIFVGSTEDGVGLESFLTQVRQVSGNRMTVGVRCGAEGEPIQGYWKVRLGTYFEPSRFEGVPYRVHGTASTDVRLFRWDLFHIVSAFDFRVGTAIDIANRYYNFGLSIGVWH